MIIFLQGRPTDRNMLDYRARLKVNFLSGLHLNEHVRSKRAGGKTASPDNFYLLPWALRNSWNLLTTSAIFITSHSIPQNVTPCFGCKENYQGGKAFKCSHIFYSMQIVRQEQLANLVPLNKISLLPPACFLCPKESL